MKNGYIKTAAATPYITVADCNANGNEISRLIHEMEKEHVKVMTFPELCITGYTCQDLFLQRRLLDSAWEWRDEPTPYRVCLSEIMENYIMWQQF